MATSHKVEENQASGRGWKTNDLQGPSRTFSPVYLWSHHNPNTGEGGVGPYFQVPDDKEETTILKESGWCLQDMGTYLGAFHKYDHFFLTIGFSVT